MFKIRETNPYDEISDEENALLRCVEQNMTNVEIATTLQMTYNQVLAMKRSLTVRGIFVKPRRTGLSEEQMNELIAMSKDGFKSAMIMKKLGLTVSKFNYYKNVLRAEGKL